MSGFSESTAQADNAYVRVAEKMRGCWVGPFPIREFLGLLPGRKPYRATPLPPPDIFGEISVDESKKEKEIYLSLVTHTIFGFISVLTVL